MDAFICDLKVGYNHQVDVTHVNDPKSFFVRPAHVADLMHLIERPGFGLISANTMRSGQRVVYKSETLGKFVRGEVCFINTDGENVACDIRAIDYGCIDKSVSSHIHPPDSEAEPQNQCPGLAFHCQLHLCEPKGDNTFSKKAIDTMKSFISEYNATITVMSKINDQLVVELRTTECPKDVAMMLALLQLTTLLGKGTPTINRHSISTAPKLSLTQTLKYKHKKLNVGDILHVRVQSGTSVSGFYVADINEFKKLRSNEPSFSLYCKSRRMEDEDIVPGRPCAVKLDNLDQYERAIIKEIKDPNSRAVLHLVDWGKEIESHFSCIRSIDKELYLTQPIIAIYCSTTEDQVWKSTLPTFFFKGYEFVIKIMELGNDADKPHKVNIYPPNCLKSI